MNKRQFLKTAATASVAAFVSRSLFGQWKSPPKTFTYKTADGCDMSLKADPRLVPARKNLAINYFNLGKYDLATTEFQELIKENGESRSVALLFLGIIAEEQGNFSQAASLLGESGELVFHYPRAVLSLALPLLQHFCVGLPHVGIPPSCPRSPTA